MSSSQLSENEEVVFAEGVELVIVAAVPWPEARRMILGLSDGPDAD